VIEEEKKNAVTTGTTNRVAAGTNVETGIVKKKRGQSESGKRGVRCTGVRRKAARA